MNHTALVLKGIVATFPRLRATMLPPSITAVYNGFLLIIELPFMHLYLNGPSIGGYGFWQNAPLASICETITNVDRAHWESHEEICTDLIYNRFSGFMICIYVLIYASTFAGFYVYVLCNMCYCPCRNLRIKK
jgi:hypothetical protein